MIKKNYIFIVTALVFIFSIFHFDYNKFSSSKIEIISLDSEKHMHLPSLRVYYSKDKSEFQDFFVFEKKYNIRVTRKPVWGICLLKDIAVTSLKVMNRRLTLLDSKSDLCIAESEIGLINKKESTRTLKVAYVLTVIFITALAYFLLILLVSIIKLYRYNREQFFNSSLCLGFVGAIGISWWTLTFPAIFDTDFFDTYFQSSRGFVSGWFSYVNNLSVMMILNITEKLWFFGFVCLLIFVFLSLKYIHLIREFNLNKKWIIYFFIVITLPPIGFMSFHLTRDLIVSYLNILLGLSLFYAYKKSLKGEKKLTVTDYLLVISSVLVTSIRREAILVAALFLIFYIFVSKIEKKSAYIMIFFFSVMVMFSNILSNAIVINTGSIDKILVTVSHHISSIITKDYETEDVNQDKEEIETFYKYDMLKKYHDSSVVSHIHKGALKRVDKNREEKLKSLLSFNLNLIRNNLGIFLESRLEMMHHMFGATKKTILLPRDLEYMKHSEHLRNMGNYNNFFVGSESQISKISKVGFKFQEAHHSNVYIKKLYIVYPSLIICIIAIFFIKILPLSAMASIVVLCRVPAFFFLTPAAQFKYVYDVYAFGFLIIPFIIWELRSRETQRLFERFNLKS